MGGNIGETTLQEDVGVVSDDRIDSGGLIASQDDAGEHERDHVFSPKERLPGLRCCRSTSFFGGDDLLHLPELEIRLLARTGAKQRRVGSFFLAVPQQPTRRLRNHEATNHE